MLKKKLENNLNNEEGSGLILALMVLLVLSVLGASLGVLTVGSFKLGNVNRDSNSAYYIAEAGANLRYEELKENVSNAYADSSSDTIFFSAINKAITGVVDYDNIFEPQFADKPTASVTTEQQTTEGEERDYVIKSTGEIAGKKRTVEKKVKVTWKSKSAGESSIDIPEAVIIAKEKLDTQGDNIIFGNIYSKKVEAAGVLTMNGGDVYSEILEAQGNISVANLEHQKRNVYVKTLKINSGMLNINGNLYSEDYVGNVNATVKHGYSSGNSVDVFNNINTLPTRIENYVKPLRDKEMPEFELKKGKYTTEKIYYEAGDLKFQEETGTIVIEDKNVVIFADKLKLKDSNLDVVGKGTLTIVVSGTVDFQDAVFNSNKANVRIISTDGKSIQIENQERVSSVSAQIIAPKSTFEMQAKTNNEFKSEFFGSVIAAKMKVQTDDLSKNTLTYKEFEFDSSDIEGGTDNSDVDIEDLIEVEPAIESD